MGHVEVMYKLDTMVTILHFEYLSIEYKPGYSFKPESLDGTPL